MIATKDALLAGVLDRSNPYLTAAKTCNGAATDKGSWLLRSDCDGIYRLSDPGSGRKDAIAQQPCSYCFFDPIRANPTGVSWTYLLTRCGHRSRASSWYAFFRSVINGLNILLGNIHAMAGEAVILGHPLAALYGVVSSGKRLLRRPGLQLCIDPFPHASAALS